MNYFVLSPMIPGTLTESASLDLSGPRPKTVKLGFEFDYLPYDDFICGGGDVFLASPELAKSFERAGLSGFSIGEATLTVGDNFKDFEGDIAVPSYEWVKIHGSPGDDDFGIFDGFTIVVSQRVLDVLVKFRLDNNSSTEKFTSSLRRTLWDRVKGRSPGETLDESISLPEE